MYGEKQENEDFIKSYIEESLGEKVDLLRYTYLFFGCRVLNIKNQFLYFCFNQIYKKKIKVEFSFFNTVNYSSERKWAYLYYQFKGCWGSPTLLFYCYKF